jgi:hypothetical protein
MFVVRLEKLAQGARVRCVLPLPALLLPVNLTKNKGGEVFMEIFSLWRLGGDCETPRDTGQRIRTVLRFMFRKRMTQYACHKA